DREHPERAERRQPNTQERLVSSSQRAPDVRLLTRQLAHHATRDIFDFTHVVAAVPDRGVTHTRGVDVEIPERVLAQLIEILIGKPGAAGVPPGRVAGPPAEPDSAP